jgi:hypothetical protein
MLPNLWQVLLFAIERRKKDFETFFGNDYFSPQSENLSNFRRRQLAGDASSPNVGNFGDALDVQNRRHLSETTKLFPD